MNAYKGRLKRKRPFRGDLPFVVGSDGIPIVYPPKNSDACESEDIDESVQKRVNAILEKTVGSEEE